jgi:hypothetical protein
MLVFDLGNLYPANYAYNKGKAPGQLTATDASPNANRLRPLCPWPACPKSTGAPGTENSAASYKCATD